MAPVPYGARVDWGAFWSAVAGAVVGGGASIAATRMLIKQSKEDAVVQQAKDLANEWLKSKDSRLQERAGVIYGALSRSLRSKAKRRQVVQQAFDSMDLDNIEKIVTDARSIEASGEDEASLEEED